MVVFQLSLIFRRNRVIAARCVRPRRDHLRSPRTPEKHLRSPRTPEKHLRSPRTPEKHLRSPRALDSRGSLRSSLPAVAAVLASPCFVESARPSGVRQGVVVPGERRGPTPPRAGAAGCGSARSLRSRPHRRWRPRASSRRNRPATRPFAGRERVAEHRGARATWGRAGTRRPSTVQAPGGLEGRTRSTHPGRRKHRGSRDASGVSRHHERALRALSNDSEGSEATGARSAARPGWSSG
jgi:hypothetical protein